MKSVSIAAMRRLESVAIDSGISGFVLMERAGIAAAELVRREALRRNCRRIIVVTGKGNNAGDGFVVAAHLPDFAVTLHAAAPVALLKGNAARHAACLPQDVCVVESEMPPDFLPDTLIVDALLGTGFSGTVREPLAAFIRAMNASRRPVVSLDLPSGLDGDSGEAELAVCADATITFGLPKAGLFRGRGPELAGVLSVGSLGIPAEMIAECPAEFETIFADDIAPLLPRLRFDEYKNTRGRVLIAGGSAEYPGAPLLSALGAMRAGAGFVRFAAVALPYAPLPAALVVHRLPPSSGCFGRAAAARMRELLPLVDAIVAGPGWGSGRDLAAVMRVILESGLPAVFDADALNVFARVPALRILTTETILTPHAGEAARLFAARDCAMPQERVTAALTLAREYGAVVILKGPQSVVAAPDGRYAVNSSGTPALGVCGSGDVLSGVAGAFLAKGHSAYDAARMAVFVHGAAGDVVPQRGLIADDLPALIRDEMKKIEECAAIAPNSYHRAFGVDLCR